MWDECVESTRSTPMRTVSCIIVHQAALSFMKRFICPRTLSHRHTLFSPTISGRKHLVWSWLVALLQLIRYHKALHMHADVYPHTFYYSLFTRLISLSMVAILSRDVNHICWCPAVMWYSCLRQLVLYWENANLSTIRDETYSLLQSSFKHLPVKWSRSSHEILYARWHRASHKQHSYTITLCTSRDVAVLVSRITASGWQIEFTS